MNTNNLLVESFADTIILYSLLKKLNLSWEEWPAYELGIIDNNGKLLRLPRNPEERKSWTMLDKFIANLKRILQKFIGKSKLTSYLTSTYLLKDSYHNLVMFSKNEYLFEDCINEFNSKTYTEQKEIYYFFENLKQLINTNKKINILNENCDVELYNLILKNYDIVDSYINEKREKNMNVIDKFLRFLVEDEGTATNSSSIVGTDLSIGNTEKRDPYVNQYNKKPNEAVEDIEKMDKEKIEVKETPNEIEQELENNMLEPDEYIKGFPCFNIEKQEEYHSFCMGKKVYHRWSKHTKEEHIRQWANANPGKSFYVSHLGSYTFINRGKK